MRMVYCVKNVCYDIFIPHEGNAYRPHALHPHRTAAYAAFFTLLKLFVVAVAFTIPAGTFASPEASQALLGQLMEQTNIFRQSQSAEMLLADARLANSASAKVSDMVVNDYFGHQSPDGSGPERFMLDAGYPYVIAGENLAMGYADAREIVEAWAASSTHRQNLLDPNFADVGFGVHGGTSQGFPTLFVVQHLGKIAVEHVPFTMVAASPLPKVARPVIDDTRSRIAWSAEGDSTTLTASVYVEGAVDKTSVEVRGYEIPLAPEPNDPEVFTGSTTVPVKSDDFFHVVTPPTLTILSTDATAITAPIAWDTPPRPRMTLLDRYAAARSLLPRTFGPLFQTSRAILLAAFALFALAWLINFFVEIRRQHLDLLVPGGALVLLLGFFVLV